ncbi:MAG: hypothetical protein IKK79_04145 [Spirochaetaceae bacterium]|nr:hypothetical protein [Spirochaetaceae bacterium]
MRTSETEYTIKSVCLTIAVAIILVLPPVALDCQPSRLTPAHPPAAFL